MYLDLRDILTSLAKHRSSYNTLATLLYGTGLKGKSILYVKCSYLQKSPKPLSPGRRPDRPIVDARHCRGSCPVKPGRLQNLDYAACRWVEIPNIMDPCPCSRMPCALWPVVSNQTVPTSIGFTVFARYTV